jgi:hypothetical protein
MEPAPGARPTSVGLAMPNGLPTSTRSTGAAAQTAASALRTAKSGVGHQEARSKQVVGQSPARSSPLETTTVERERAFGFSERIDAVLPDGGRLMIHIRRASLLLAPGHGHPCTRFYGMRSKLLTAKIRGAATPYAAFALPEPGAGAGR